MRDYRDIPVVSQGKGKHDINEPSFLDLSGLPEVSWVGVVDEVKGLGEHPSSAGLDLKMKREVRAGLVTGGLVAQIPRVRDDRER